MKFYLTLAVLCCAASLSAQSYTVSSGAMTSSYTDLASPTNVTLDPGSSALSVAVNFPGGVDFEYFGTTYTSMHITTHGTVCLGTTPIISKLPAHSTAPGLVISPAWEYYNPQLKLGNMINLGTVGYTTSNSSIEIEWNNVPLYSNTNVGLRCKVILNRSAKTIEFQYGPVAAGATGVTASATNSCAISSSTIGTTAQEIINGVDSGFVSATGGITQYPTGRYIRFTPTSGGGNAAPFIGAVSGMSLIGNGSNHNVSYNDTVSGEQLRVTISDADNDATSISTTITNVGSTGILSAEWTKGPTAVSYSLNLNTGTFNTVAGVTHVVTITANDGTDTTVFTFNIVQAPQAGAPQIGVSDGAAVANGASATGSNRAFGSQLVSAGGTTPVTITVSNTGSAALTLSTPTLTGAGGGEFVLNTPGFPASVAAAGSISFTVEFNPTAAGSFSANVEIVHNDSSTATPFSFEVTGVGITSTPAPIVVVRDTNASGTVISNGSAAAGTRSFGTVLVASIPTSNNTVHIKNEGTATMTLITPTISGSGFTLDPSGFLTSLAPGASCTIGFALTSTTGGSYSATISFGHDDSTTTTPFSFDLSGTVDDGTGGGGISLGSGGGGSGCIAADSRTTLWAILVLLSSAVLIYRRNKLA